MTLEIHNVSVVGVGLIGSAWAAFFASRGFPVAMFDSRFEGLLDGYRRAAAQLESLRRLGCVTADSATPAEPLLRMADSLEDAVADAELVIEAAPERYEVKVPLFAALDRSTHPECVLASSSSGLLMTRIQQQLRHPQRTLISHPFNPVHLVPLVELVGGERTDPALLEQMREFFERLGKVAIIVRKEVPGFIGNRLQAAVWREAIQLVLDGVGTVEDVDRALCAGPGLRWALMGQHLIFHLGGGCGGIEYFLQHIGDKWQELWADMANWTAIPPDANAALTQGVRDEMGSRSREDVEAWRDEKLASLLKLLYP
jgi:3-hydroxyacyl-CoA dehydrogenase